MVKLIKYRSRKTGLPPGTPVFLGEKKTEEVKITIIDYDRDNCNIIEPPQVEECSRYRDTPTVTWINVAGIHDISIIESLCKSYGLHPLTVEDIFNLEQRPKIDIFDNYIFMVLKLHTYNKEDIEVDVEQVSLVLGENFVLTFMETESEVFKPLIKRISTNKGRIRKSGADYLAYAIMDILVDSYFNILEAVGEDIEGLEEEIVTSPSRETVERILFLKREMLFLRKSVWPLREVLNSLMRDETPIINESTVIYIRDVYDHTIQIIDTVETYRDMISGMLDVYLSSISNRMNEIMKVLTIFASIFIPLTFIAGIYG
ncbi:MAG: magnesium and cobalt transport protein CorA, partial [Nitrospirae bacterium]